MKSCRRKYAEDGNSAGLRFGIFGLRDAYCSFLCPFPSIRWQVSTAVNMNKGGYRRRGVLRLGFLCFASLGLRDAFVAFEFEFEFTLSFSMGCILAIVFEVEIVMRLSCRRCD